MSQNHESRLTSNHSKTSGFWRGLIAGFIPHSFCLLFIVFSTIGAVGASALIKKFLFLPHFFAFLIVCSFVFAIISAVLYLRRCGCFSWTGLKDKRRYLFLLFATTTIVNFLLMAVVFPSINKSQSATAVAAGSLDNAQTIVVAIDIPCSGHAPLVINDLILVAGIESVDFITYNNLKIIYNPQLISIEQIRALEVFRSFPILAINNS